MNRFLWAARGDRRRLKLAALCQFTLPGQPVIYYGAEVGLSQVHDVAEPGHGLEEARLPHPWGDTQDRDLLAFYRALIALRSPHRQVLQAGEQVLSYTLASAPDGAAPEFCVALNLSAQPCTLSLAGKWDKLVLSTGPACTLAALPDGAQIHLAPLGGVLLAHE